MVMRVNQVAAEFRKVSNKQMAETTKRTIRENVSINAQLGKMSDKTMELIQVSLLQQGVFVVFAINGMWGGMMLCSSNYAILNSLKTKWLEAVSVFVQWA